LVEQNKTSIQNTYTTVNGVLISHGLKNDMRGRYNNWLIEIKGIICYTELILTFLTNFTAKNIKKANPIIHVSTITVRTGNLSEAEQNDTDEDESGSEMVNPSSFCKSTVLFVQ